MRIKVYILIIFTVICRLEVSAEKVDTFNLLLPVDTAFVQAIQYDNQTYSEFKKDKAYDYYHAKPESESFWNMLRWSIRQLLSEYFRLDLTEKQAKITFWIIAALIVAGIFLLFYFFRPSWFYINKKRKITFGVEDEDIHALDFEQLIKNALKSEQYAEAIRWKYLQLLKTLHSKELISWDAHKTVIEYVYEIKQPDLKSKFKEVSQLFLYYRYGNFEASRENWEEFSKLVYKCY